MKKISLIIVLVASFCFNCLLSAGKTIVSIKGNQFFVNGKPTYCGRSWNGHKIEGLLINSRMVQGIFDDLNPENVNSFAYPDTKKWDADRNTNEFIAAMPEWNSYGLNSFTLNMQGGSPSGYGASKCLNPGFYKDGSLMEPYMKRLDKILKRADELHMVVILGLFYFGQDQYLTDEKAVVNATKNTINWLFDKGYRNVIIEIANESIDNGTYNHSILFPNRIHELINLVRTMKRNGYHYLASTSFGGTVVPTPNVVKTSDFLLIHGNGADKPEMIQTLIDNTRKVAGYRKMPVVINEDDHFDFEKENNNFTVSVKNDVSWGYFDFRFPGETDFKEGFQSVPVDWRINSKRKKAFFEKVKEITGGVENTPELSSKWTNLLDENLSNFDKFIGVPHTSLTKLPGSPKGDGVNGIPLGLNNDPLNVFSVIKENNELILRMSGEIFGGLSTKKSYRNYHLIAKFKWGEKKFEPRLEKPRDNGILYRCSSNHGKECNAWMNSIEFQVQEKEMGDLYVLCKRRHLDVPSKIDNDSQMVYVPKSESKCFGWGLPNGTNRGRCKAMPHSEKPNGEWNTLELICLGNLSMHIVNGQVVNVIREVDDVVGENNVKYKCEGKIQFQCEGAEAYYKELKIREITKIPAKYLNQ